MLGHRKSEGDPHAINRERLRTRLRQTLTEASRSIHSNSEEANKAQTAGKTPVPACTTQPRFKGLEPTWLQVASTRLPAGFLSQDQEPISLSLIPPVSPQFQLSSLLLPLAPPSPNVRSDLLHSVRQQAWNFRETIPTGQRGRTMHFTVFLPDSVCSSHKIWPTCGTVEITPSHNHWCLLYLYLT